MVAARLALRRASPVVVAFCAPLAITLADIGFTTIRAGVYTLLLVAIFLTLVNDDRIEPRPARFLLSYVALVILWINLHGGWVVGVVAVACHALEQALRRRPISTSPPRWRRRRRSCSPRRTGAITRSAGGAASRTRATGSPSGRR